VGVQIESLAIPMITSTSTELAFESEFTQILREEFISHARVPIVSREEAQAVLTGNVYEIRTDAVSYDLQTFTVEGNPVVYGLTNRRRLIVKLDAKLTDRDTGAVIWHERAMEEDGIFRVNTDPLETRYQKREALKRIARRLAERMFQKTLERF
jgi:hypothetical protein